MTRGVRPLQTNGNEIPITNEDGKEAGCTVEQTELRVGGAVVASRETWQMAEAAARFLLPLPLRTLRWGDCRDWFVRGLKWHGPLCRQDDNKNEIYLALLL